MKKLIAILLLLIIAATLLCGCLDNRTVQHDWDRMMLIERYKDFDIYADTETGVEYLVYSSTYRLSVAPILNPDGTPVLAPNFDAREDRP